MAFAGMGTWGPRKQDLIRLNAVGAAAGAESPTWETDPDGFWGWSFKEHAVPGKVESLTSRFEMPHEVYPYISELEWHLHWRFSSADAGNVKMFFAYKYALPGAAAVVVTSGTYYTIAAPGNTNVQMTTFRTDTGLTWPRTPGAMVTVEIGRAASHADDTYDGHIYYSGCHAHGLVLGQGSAP